jgi:hypothetical protein
MGLDRISGVFMQIATVSRCSETSSHASAVRRVARLPLWLV